MTDSKNRRSDPPEVSVCIANYNGIEFIAACIDSVLAQAPEIGIEIIVHDDASTDFSPELIEKQYPQVHMIRSRENVGFCVANNRMVTKASGRYLLLLNNDAELFPDAVSVLISEANKLQSLAILGLPQFDAETGQLLDIGSRLDLFLNPIPNRNPLVQDVGMVMGACLWIPRRLWIELGGFPEWFGSIAEDLQLCCAARLMGYPVRSIGRSGYRHWVGQSFGGGKTQGSRLVTTYRRRALSERNKTFVLMMSFPSPWIVVILPLHLLLLFFEALVLSLLQLDATILGKIYFPVFKALADRRKLLVAGRRELQFRKTPEGGRLFFSSIQWWPHKLTLLIRYGIPRIR